MAFFVLSQHTRTHTHTHTHTRTHANTQILTPCVFGQKLIGNIIVNLSTVRQKSSDPQNTQVLTAVLNSSIVISMQPLEYCSSHGVRNYSYANGTGKRLALLQVNYIMAFQKRLLKIILHLLYSPKTFWLAASERLVASSFCVSAGGGVEYKGELRG